MEPIYPQRSASLSDDRGDDGCGAEVPTVRRRRPNDRRWHNHCGAVKEETSGTARGLATNRSRATPGTSWIISKELVDHPADTRNRLVLAAMESLESRELLSVTIHGDVISNNEPLSVMSCTSSSSAFDANTSGLKKRDIAFLQKAGHQTCLRSLLVLCAITCG